jgi:hypothetical protein
MVALTLLKPASARAADGSSPSADAYAPVLSEPLPASSRGGPYAPAAGVELGLGPEYPSFRAPLGQMLLRLGASFRLDRDLAVAAGGESGIALSVGSTSPNYGYLLRVPFKVFADVIVSRLLDFRTHRYANLHLGGSVGQEFALAAQCTSGECNYIPAAMYFGFGVRVGLSYSAETRSSVGLFTRFDNDVAQCSGLTNCKAYIQTYTWNLAWTLF